MMMHGFAGQIERPLERREQLDENGPQRRFSGAPRSRLGSRARVEREQETALPRRRIARDQSGFDLLEQRRIDGSVGEQSESRERVFVSPSLRRAAQSAPGGCSRRRVRA